MYPRGGTPYDFSPIFGEERPASTNAAIGALLIGALLVAGLSRRRA